MPSQYRNEVAAHLFGTQLAPHKAVPVLPQQRQLLQVLGQRAGILNRVWRQVQVDGPRCLQHAWLSFLQQQTEVLGTVPS